MKIIVVGCGKIGTAVLSRLVAEGHDVVAVDTDAAVVEELTNIYDVMGVCGNGVDPDILTEAGAGDADLVIAVAGSDEQNMLICFFARKLGTANTVARIRKPAYNDHSTDFFRNNLELSLIITPEQLAARELYHILKFPSAVKIETFSRGHLEMIELRLKPDSALDGVKLSDLRERYRATVLVCCVGRGDSVIIPDGRFELKSGDRIGITASPAEISKFLKAVGLLQKQARDVIILGGSRTGYYLAARLLDSGCSVKIIDQDEKICNQLCDALPRAVVIQGDGTRQELLIEEGLRTADAFAALTGTDEENILISIYAASQKVPKVIPKINSEEMASLAGRLGIDSFVSPKKAVADVLVQHARALENSRGSRVETLYKLMDEKVEALEFSVIKNSPLCGIPLKQLSLKSNLLVGGIIRDRKTIIPNGNDCMLPGDHIVVISGIEGLSDLTDILQ